MTDRDLALVRAALEAAARWMRKAGYRQEAPLMLEDCDPAAIVARVEEKLCLSKCNDHNCVVSGTCLGECGRYRRGK